MGFVFLVYTLDPKAHGKMKVLSPNNILREPQHTPRAYPMNPQTPKWKEFLHKKVSWGSGVCSRGMLENS